MNLPIFRHTPIESVKTTPVKSLTECNRGEPTSGVTTSKTYERQWVTRPPRGNEPTHSKTPGRNQDDVYWCLRVGDPSLGPD